MILLLGLSAHLPAIERPKALDEEQPNDRPAQSEAKEVQQEREAIPQQEATAWFGVLSDPADATLKAHLGLNEGVVLGYVAKGSPAAEAGFARHDILTEIDGRAIASQDDLREEIQSHKPGDKVKVAMVRKGKPEVREVTLGERPADLPAVPRAPRLEKLPDADALPEGAPRGRDFPELRERLKDFEKLFPNGGDDLQRQLDEQMKNLRKHLQELEKNGGLKFDLDMFDNFEGPNENPFKFNFKASGTFKLKDNEGSVEMKMNDGGKEVEVRDNEGNLLFEGPWETDQDKAAAPPEIRERIEQLNVDGNGLRFRLENLPEPEMELPEPEEEELE